MTVRRRAWTFATRLLKRSIDFVGGDRAAFISAELAEELAPTVSQKTAFGTIQFFCPGKVPELRARTLFVKEPETLAWIETFQDGEVMWDIGANIGVYSLYAARKGHSVLAFEPSPSNYYVLSRNIEINRLDDRISAYCIAFNDTTKLDALYMVNTELGEAGNSFGEAVDWQGKPFAASLKQAMIGFSMDDFTGLFSPLFPNHIKIDVDGIENKIIKGAKRILADERLKSVLVELNPDRTDYCAEVISVFEDCGLESCEQEDRRISYDSEGAGVYNHIFKRLRHAKV